MKRKERLRALGLAWLLATTTVQAGEMYRWVDKEGRVHFSDKPPPDDAKQSLQMAAPVRNSMNETSSESGESASEQATRMRQTSEGIEADRSARQQKKNENAANKRKQEQACAAAKKEMERFNTANVKFLVDKNKQRREMSDAEFDAIEKQLRGDVENACR